jgi:diacylglycerol kinase (ATP)
MRIQVIYNPVAGLRDSHSDLAEAVAFWQAQGWDVAMGETAGPGDALAMAQAAAAAGCDVVVAAGGDGTIGQVASGLAGSRCALAVFPIGTGNVWAHMLNLPLASLTHRGAALEAAKVLLEGRVHEVDLGQVGERHFLLWTGIGFDAQIARDVEPHREIRRNLGNLTYYVTAFAVSVGLRGTRVTIVIDGKAVRKRVLLIVVTNAQLYGSSWKLAPTARLDDGFLEVYVFKGGNMIDALRHFGMIVIGKHLQDPRVDVYRGQTIEIRGGKPLPLHLDGDPAGQTPIKISVAPRMLRVIVPSSASPSLFAMGSGVEVAAALGGQQVEDGAQL